MNEAVVRVEKASNGFVLECGSQTEVYRSLDEVVQRLRTLLGDPVTRTTRLGGELA